VEQPARPEYHEGVGLSCGASRLAPLRSLRSLRVEPTVRPASRSAWVRTSRAPSKRREWD